MSGYDTYDEELNQKAIDEKAASAKHDSTFHNELVKRLSFLEKKISKISSREKLIHLILASNDFLERKLAFLKYDQLLIEEIKKGDK